MRRSRPAALVVLLAALLIPVLATSALAQSSANPGVYPTTARPFGNSYAQWSTAWWKWALALPVEGHPFIDPGFDCNSVNNGQSGPVWFLALSSNPPLVERRCTIPVGRAIYLALANAECSSLEPTFPDGTGGQTASAQRDCANFFANHIVVSSLFCTIDGQSVQNLGTYRFVSSQFTFNAPTPWIFGDTGGTGTSVSDGYFVMVKPLPIGTHTLTCGGAFDFGFGFGNTYQLTIQE